MGHLLKTVNPAAAARIEQDAAAVDVRLPGTGMPVLYHLRPGEMRMGRTAFPALVLGRSAAGGLDLIVFMGANEIIQQERVSAYNGDGRGWSPIDAVVIDADPVSAQDIGASEGVVTTAPNDAVARLLQQVFGDYHATDEPIMAVLNEFEERIAALERAAKPKPVARGPGRPKRS